MNNLIKTIMDKKNYYDITDRFDDSSCCSGVVSIPEHFPQQKFFKKLHEICGKIKTTSSFSYKTLIKILNETKEGTDNIKTIIKDLINGGYLKKNKKGNYNPGGNTIYLFYSVHHLYY